MASFSGNLPEDPVVFASEEDPSDQTGADQKAPWKILVVDDQEDVHKITRIALQDYDFDQKGVNILSAYSEADVRSVFEAESDIALVLLDVVMENDDTGLAIVEYIRNELNNRLVRIVMRTGQPGKAPEKEVITRYDINDYKTKPELTAQKLFTSVTACLRAYSSLKAIERNRSGLETILSSTSKVFKHQSFPKFGENVLEQLSRILDREMADMDSAYLVGMPNSSVLVMAGTGRFSDKAGKTISEAMPDKVVQSAGQFSGTAWEDFSGNAYTGIFKSKEGFLSLLHLSGCSLTDVEKSLVRIYAGNIAICFDNISLAREIINTQKEVILTLGEIVETRSQETAHHVTRVAEICYLMARKCGVEEENCEILRLASPMHDVGKIGVPEAILNKPGKLTDAEFQVIQQHSRTGYEILKKSKRPIMKTAAIVALQHHEKWDGTGYPQGLQGEEIHIYGRIAAIADVFDALSHTRCYKSAWEMDRILDLFEKESGRHFDADLVKVFLSDISEFEAINARFPE